MDDRLEVFQVFVNIGVHLIRCISIVNKNVELNHNKFFSKTHSNEGAHTLCAPRIRVGFSQLVSTRIF